MLCSESIGSSGPISYQFIHYHISQFYHSVHRQNFTIWLFNEIREIKREIAILRSVNILKILSFNYDLPDVNCFVRIKCWLCTKSFGDDQFNFETFCFQAQLTPISELKTSRRLSANKMTKDIFNVASILKLDKL